MVNITILEHLLVFLLRSHFQTIVHQSLMIILFWKDNYTNNFKIIMETYKFYVKLEGTTYGPYSAAEINDLELLDDILVTEESMNGQWLPASKFDFEDMVRKEAGTITQTKPTSKYVINSDGSVTNHNGWQPTTPQVPLQPNQPATGPISPEDNSTPWGWCILAFIIPLVGWILYFSWRRTKPNKASAVCTWAWIGFGVNLILMFI